MKSVYVTTSWDDGRKQDLRLSRLLDKYCLKGTFYSLIDNGDFDLIESRDILSISQRHEIGAHTLSHSDLTKLSDEKVKNEVLLSKQHWTQILNREITMFSYPYGKNNKKVVNIVRSSGFKGARIVRWLCRDVPKDPYRLAPSCHAYPHSKLINIAHLLKNKDLHGLTRYLITNKMTCGWDRIAINLFDYISQKGGVWHLWGHSWEIDKFDLWTKLEMVFEYVSNREGVIYCTNGELVDQLF